MTNIYNAIQNLYNMDKTTWQEVLSEMYNLVTNVNNKFDVFEAKFGMMLGEQVTRELKKMYNDGSLSSLINDVLLKDINTKIDSNYTVLDNKIDTINTELSSQLDAITLNAFNLADIKKYIALNKNVNINIGSKIEVTENITIPSNITLTFSHNGMFSVKANTTLTVNGYIECGHRQIFNFEDITSIVNATETSETWITKPVTKTGIKVAWFGAKGNALFNWDTHNVYQGENDTLAFKRCMKYVECISQKQKNGYMGMTKITVKLMPNSCYYVEGDNILGVQNNDSVGISYEVIGNGSVIYHKILNNTDSFINNYGLIYRPKFKGFSYLPFGFVGRKGYFVNSSEVNAIANRGEFEDIIVSQLNYRSGNDVIFNIVSNVMIDNIFHKNCMYMNCNKIYYNTNTEAMGWVFEKCFLATSTPNSIYFHSNCNLGGGFTIKECETLFNSTSSTFVKLEKQVNQVLFNINTRTECQTSNLTLIDVDGGLVNVDGINLVNGSGGQTGTNIISLINRNNAYVEFKKCVLTHNFTLKSNLNKYITKVLTIDTCTLVDNNLAITTSPTISVLNDLNQLKTYSEYLSSNEKIGIVEVKNLLNGELRGKVLDINYGGCQRKIFNIEVLANEKTTLPAFIIIDDIKINQLTKDLANVNKIKVEMLGNGDYVEYNYTIDLSTYNGTPNNFFITSPLIKKIRFTFMKDDSVVTDILKIPLVYAEIKYKQMLESVEFGERYYCSAIVKK